tara:strand:- start:23053 stop:24024 length:972 start_codon:yes stop_codon:yes gene_type:complete
MNILVTGCAGFIGFHIVEKLIQNRRISEKIFGIDNINSYYDVDLKKNRLKILKKNKNFIFEKIDICNFNKLENFCKKNKIKKIIHLAAQAGVRYSIDNPKTYHDNNINGFFNILEVSRILKINHLICASTSSVYGKNNRYPTKENFITDSPKSFYAATKKCNEIMAYSYSEIYNLPITMLRFFTVYGSLGRPDMSLFKFTKNILNNKKIDVYNYGNHIRDFTHVYDVANCVIKIINKKTKNNPQFNILNLSGSNPQKLKYFIKLIEKKLNTKSKKNMMKMQKGDVHKSHGDNTKLLNYIGKYNFQPIERGIEEFIDWYFFYYK